MRSIVFAIIGIALLSGTAVASEKEIWACRSGNPGAQPILHLVEWDSRSYVKFAHLRFSAAYALEDEGARGWYFNNDGSGYYRYALLLEPDGKAWLHHFSRKDGEVASEALDHFVCTKTA